MFGKGCQVHSVFHKITISNRQHANFQREKHAENKIFSKKCLKILHFQPSDDDVTRPSRGWRRVPRVFRWG